MTFQSLEVYLLMLMNKKQQKYANRLQTGLVSMDIHPLKLRGPTYFNLISFLFIDLLHVTLVTSIKLTLLFHVSHCVKLIRSKLQENREKYSTLESSHQQLQEKITRMENNLQRKKEELKKTTTEFKEMESNIEQVQSST